MDTAWATEKLQKFLDHADAWVAAKSDTPEESLQLDKMTMASPTISRILEIVDPALADEFVRFKNVYSQRRVALTALGAVKDMDEIDEKLGASRISISTQSLHENVWEAARARWDSGQFGDAVQRAATFVAATVRNLTGRYDIGETALMQQAFSSKDPEVDSPRLRWPGDENDLTVRSMNDGLRNLAPGVFMAIRNPATHRIEEITHDQAIEQLATLSLLSRWIDACQLVTASNR